MNISFGNPRPARRSSFGLSYGTNLGAGKALGPTGTKILGIVFIIIAIGILIGGYFFYTAKTKFLASATETKGIVDRVDLTRKYDSNKGDTYVYTPIVKFTAGGEEITFNGAESSGSSKYRQGQEVTVLYDPQNPYKAEIKSSTGPWFIVAIFGLVALLLAGIGIYVLFFKKFAPQAQTPVAPTNEQVSY